METQRNTERMSKCPRFAYCNAPKCPLDELKDKRVFKAGDDKCTLRKDTRMKLGRDLASKGLTTRELGGLKGWKNISDEVKDRVASVGSTALKNYQRAFVQK